MDFFNRLNLYILTMSLGGAVIGIDLGLIATTLAQPSFNTYMFPPGTRNVSSLIGAIVSISSAGNVLGSLSNGLLLEKLGRRQTLLVSTFFTIVGSVFQTCANGVPLMIVGRCVAGIALGILNPTIPVYISELARPAERARLVGVFGFLVAIGFCLANWIGYTCSFAEGDTGWRVGLAMQCPLAVVLMGLSFTLPESPRWLAQQERYEEFESSLKRLYPNEDITLTAHSIRTQITYEALHRQSTTLGHALLELFNRQNIKRTAMAIAVMQVGILSGSLAIQNYQGILYASLGFEGKRAILIAGFYGFMGVVGQALSLVGVADRWGRRATMWIGCLILASMLAILMTLSKFYGDGTHPAGARAGIAFIFLYSLLYAVFFNSTLYTIAAETFPTHLRGYGTSVAALCQGVTAIWMGQVTPFAFAKLGWRYYGVFVGCLAALSGVYAKWLAETKGVGLEAVAGEWGDEVVAEGEGAGVGAEKSVVGQADNSARARSESVVIDG